MPTFHRCGRRRKHCRFGNLTDLSFLGYHCGFHPCSRLAGKRWRRSRALLVLRGQLPVAGSFLRTSRLVVNTLQRAAANRCFRESLRPGMQGCQPLIDPQIAGRLRQGRHQRPQGLGRHVVGDEQLGIGQGRAHCQRHIVGVALINERRGGLQFIHHHCALFRADQPFARGSAQLAQYLLIVAGMNLVLRLELGQFQIVVARLFQLVGLHVGMRQQFVNLGDVGCVSRLVQQFE